MKTDLLKKALKRHKAFKNEFKTYYVDDKKKTSKPDVPAGLYEQCPSCKSNLNRKDLEKNHYVCESCGHHFRIRALERIELTADKHTFLEKGRGFITLNPLFQEGYEQKLENARKRSGTDDAFVYGYAEIGGEPCVLGVLDSHFMMGSMGSVVGEKVVKSAEYAMVKKLPLIIFSASGGARMQEGIFSLMQMAKTSGAIKKLHEQGLLYISVLTHPTTGGVSASFATLGDINIGEPGALIGFAGPRVIKQTIKETLPEGFQRSEFLLEKGMLDKVVHRSDMKSVLSTLLQLHNPRTDTYDNT
ncbi:MAG: acetyl-CoA carboxylase, carboxyltransferase subunit beta [Bacillota bacterium]